jgi:glycosyltransferase involved in cell wall biosynthesis
MVAPPFLAVPPEHDGGAEVVVAELVDGLVDRGAEVVLFSTADSRGGFRHPCEVRALFEEAQWPPSIYAEVDHSAFVFQELLDGDDDFDLVHTHCPTLLPLASLLGTPVVSTLHHQRQEDLSRLYGSHPEVGYACSSARQRELCGPFELGAVIHHGINPGRFRLGAVRPDAVAFLGRLSEVEGPHLAIDVALRAGLAIRVGGQPHPRDAEFVEAALRSRMSEPHVEHLGEVGHSDKVELLSTARALLFPIDWEEPFGLAALEAMVCGCPVIAFRRGAAPELIDEGITGFLAEDEGQMVELLHGPARPGVFDRAACREHAIRRFSAARMVDDYLDLYASAIQRAALEPLIEFTPDLST